MNLRCCGWSTRQGIGSPGSEQSGDLDRLCLLSGPQFHPLASAELKSLTLGPWSPPELAFLTGFRHGVVEGSGAPMHGWANHDQSGLSPVIVKKCHWHTSSSIRLHIVCDYISRVEQLRHCLAINSENIFYLAL